MLPLNMDTIRLQMNLCGKNKNPFLFAINFDITEGIFIENALDQQKISFQLNGIGNKSSASVSTKSTDFKAYPISYECYEEKFKIIQKGLYRGDSFLANLTVKTPIETELSLQDIFQLSNVPYRLLVPGAFVCFSSERFVKIENGSISATPAKGTIDANIPLAEETILKDEKEMSEHVGTVDLLRNDISMVADNVRVEKFRHVDRVKIKQREFLQVASEIKGDLPDNYQASLGDIIFKMLPSGSISGVPKISTSKLVEEAEKERRGYYMGVFGYFDGIKLDSAIIMPIVEQEEDKLYFRSGEGITINSKCENEYNEMLGKIYFPFDR